MGRVNTHVSRREISSVLGYVAVFLSLIYYIYSKSDLTSFISVGQRYLMILMALITLIKLVFKDRYNLRRMFLLMCFLLISIIIFYFSKDEFPVILSLLLICSCDLDFDVITNVSYKIIIVCLSFLLILSLSGVLNNFTIMRGDAPRYAFGTIQPTIFSAICFFGIAAYAYKNRGSFKIYQLIILAFLIILVNHFTGSRNDTISMIMLLLIPLIKELLDTKFIGHLLKIVLILSYPINAAIVMIATNAFKYNYGIYNGINYDYFLSGRLRLGALALHLYPLKMLGQQVTMNGNGNGNFFINQSDYFFIDSSFLLMLLKYGIIFTTLFLLFNVYLMIRLIRGKYYCLAIILAIVGFEGSFQLTIPQYLNIFAVCLSIYKFNPDNSIQPITHIFKLPKIVWSK
ncbi:MAG: hypothetical protein ACE3JK_08225 [Sporolactobacillus sp.]